MKRMINEKLIKLLKNLGVSVSADENGNVEIGKNLEVDGKIKVPNANYTAGVQVVGDSLLVFGFADPSVDDPNKYDIAGLAIADFDEAYIGDNIVYNVETGEASGTYVALTDIAVKAYRHHLTLNGVACADFYSTQNLVCDSLQDLSTLTHDDAFSVNGDYIEAKKTAGVWQVVKADGTAVNVTAVTDAVTARY